MREYKFRAWDKKYKRMYYGDIRIVLAYRDDDIEIMQYITRKDKNNKEIYTEDIIKASFYDQESRIYHVIWNSKRAGFGLQDFDREFGGYPFDIHGLHDIEIIGNIYENPELIKPLDRTKT